MNIASSILLGLVIGAVDALGFMWTMRAFGRPGSTKNTRAVTVALEIGRLLVLCTALIFLCVRAHFQVAWLLGAALFSSFAGKTLVALRSPGPKL